jgi:hypothetical protein
LKRRARISSLINRMSGFAVANGSGRSSIRIPARSGAALPGQTGSGFRRRSRSAIAQRQHQEARPALSGGYGCRSDWSRRRCARSGQ